MAKISDFEKPSNKILFLLLEEKSNNNKTLTAEQISNIFHEKYDLLFAKKKITNCLNPLPKGQVKISLNQNKETTYEIMADGTKALEDSLKETPNYWTEKVYPQKSAPLFYKDLTTLIQKANSTKIFLVEPFFTKELIDLYLIECKNQELRVLTSQNSPEKISYLNNALPAAKLLQQQNKSFAIRANNCVHDRAIFIDGESWVVGNSFNGAGTKPTYFIKLTQKGHELKKIYDSVWAESTKILPR